MINSSDLDFFYTDRIENRGRTSEKVDFSDLPKNENFDVYVELYQSRPLQDWSLTTEQIMNRLNGLWSGNVIEKVYIAPVLGGAD